MEYVVICDNCGTASERGVNASLGWFTLNGPMGTTLYFDKWACIVAYVAANEPPTPTPLVAP
jgi:hypothetical protein